LTEQLDGYPPDIYLIMVTGLTHCQGYAERPDIYLIMVTALTHCQGYAERPDIHLIMVTALTHCQGYAEREVLCTSYVYVYIVYVDVN
jgi:hypothetical protein